MDVPLACIAFPDRTAPPGVHRPPKAETLGRLMGTLLCYCKDDPALARGLLDLAVELVAAVPAFVLSLPRGESVWEPLLAELDG